MKKSHKGLIWIIVDFLLGFLAGSLCFRGCSSSETKEDTAVQQVNLPEEESAVGDVPLDSAMQQEADSSAPGGDDVDGPGESEAREVIYYGPRLSYAKLFADLNDAHVSLAKSVGLSLIPQTREEVNSLPGLVEISDTDYYIVDDLRYSVPYLTRGAADELMAISKAFRDSLRSKNLLDYKLIVSSILRTEEDVKRLRRSGNPNASDNSAHCYGTTFDITYTRYYSEDESEAFMQPYELTKVLGEVLRDRKKMGTCLVKYEKKEHCFHITAATQ